MIYKSINGEIVLNKYGIKDDTDQLNNANHHHWSVLLQTHIQDAMDKVFCLMIKCRPVVHRYLLHHSKVQLHQHVEDILIHT